MLESPPKSYCNHWTGNKPRDCRCGEFDCQKFSWKWDPNPSSPTTTKLTDENRTVLFHPVYSQGTGIVGLPVCGEEDCI